ncbi:exosortase H [Thiorhodococcus mannitoliphagus]|uniref:Exosortase H n=1 Tax=Thiorhodococcus mannitoliphagus TaxID=329406 RepID=A0A6P1DV11_9GAMM|nr:exosortase H [Thiorhodococcus mannitoliphagus]NEX19525.1 exosortase H [Thiorhodococcus mannitoliphagus]
MTRFFLIFTLLVVVPFAAELTPIVQSVFVMPFTSVIARASALLMQAWDAEVLAQGKIIWDASSGFAVSIEAGCNGVEAGIVLLAAMLAFPATWQEKLAGITVGLVTVQGLNLIRIITLFYIGQWNQTLFEWAHLYIWQALIMLDVLVVFLLWLRWLSKREASTTAAIPASNLDG